MKKSISKRIHITGTGKVRRRAMALGHSRSNKNTSQRMRKKGARGLTGRNASSFQKYLAQ